MSYQKTIKYLDSFVNYEKKTAYRYKQSFKLGRIKEFLGRIGNPQDSFRSIHIAGTKGKGSSCVFLAHILKEAGYKTGLYTSPHLSDCRERIRVLSLKPPPKKLAGPPIILAEKASAAGKAAFGEKRENDGFEGMIPKADLVNLVQKLKPEINKFCRGSKYGPLSFFEVYTALAFEYFRQEKVDFAVLETGLGGRLDATNVANPLLCGITPISYDHMDKLGNTLAEIAKEKAGIIKSCQIPATSYQLKVVTAGQPDEAMSVIENKCNQENAELYVVGKNILFKLLSSDDDSQEFNLSGELGRINKLRIRLLGSHQLINASLSVSLALLLKKNHGVSLSTAAIRRGLKNSIWPARFEIIAKNPAIIIDGAHNVSSAQALVQAIRQTFKQKKIILVLGISRDKDIKGICSQLIPLCKGLIFTKARNLRAAEPKYIYRQISNSIPLGAVRFSSNVKQAITLAKEKAVKDDIIVICGSLFVAGEAREILLRN